jgi:hypothetical protein
MKGATWAGSGIIKAFAFYKAKIEIAEQPLFVAFLSLISLLLSCSFVADIAAVIPLFRRCYSGNNLVIPIAWSVAAEKNKFRPARGRSQPALSPQTM